MDEIRAIVAEIRNPHVRALLESFLDDAELGSAFERAPAAKSIHHARRGGLADHTLSVMRLAQSVSDRYPQLDRDLLVAGAFLHDFGKARELTAAGEDYTDEGKLVGHLVVTCQLIHEKAGKIADFPRELEWRLTHLVVAHHGRLEYGSPKEPVTLEAMVVHALDDLDTRVSSFEQLFERAEPGARWTDSRNLYGRQLLVPKREK